MYRRQSNRHEDRFPSDAATRTGLSLFAALALIAVELAPANAQDAYGGYWGGGE